MDKNSQRQNINYNYKRNKKHHYVRNSVLTLMILGGLAVGAWYCITNDIIDLNSLFNTSDNNSNTNSNASNNDNNQTNNDSSSNGNETTVATSTGYTVNNENGFIVSNYKLIENNIIENLSSYTSTTQTDYNYIRNRVSDHNAMGFNLSLVSDNTYTYKIGHWNTLNFGLLTDKALNEKETNTAYLHALNVAKVINSYQFDLIGLTEINKDSVTLTDTSAATNFLNLVNSYIPTNETDNYYYDLIVSNNSEVTINATSGQSEQVAILYNTKKFKNLETNNEDTIVGNGRFYSNPIVSWQSTNHQYVRNPFGSNFQIIDNLVNNISLTVLFSHFDSPGVSTSTNSNEVEWNGMGKQEGFEAQHIQDVMDEFKTTYESNNVIFMGDTNIKTGNQSIGFNESAIKSSGYNFAFDDSSTYNTSLATVNTVNNNPNNESKWYANDYDKIIYGLDDSVITTYNANPSVNNNLSNFSIYQLINNNQYYLTNKDI